MEPHKPTGSMTMPGSAALMTQDPGTTQQITVDRQVIANMRAVVGKMGITGTGYQQ